MILSNQSPGSKIIDGIIHKAAPGSVKDNGDQTRLRQGRERSEGFHIGKYLQTPPFFFTRDGHTLPLVDQYRGATAFLIAGGPSFGKLNSDLLKQPGILTMGLNNSPKSFRPNMWSCVDDPTHFIRSIWMDPLITKYVPFDHAEKRIFDSDKWFVMKKKVGDCPNVVFYRRNEHFQADQFLFEDTMNWGDRGDLGGGRSCMLSAVRILFLLGIRKLFLLGVDFNMSKDVKYHFDQERAKGSINGNNATYRKLIERFTLMKPIFDKHGYEVYNCNPDSALKVFPFVPFADAVRIALEDNLPVDLPNERTKDLYDRSAKEKSHELKKAPFEEDLEPKKQAAIEPPCSDCARKKKERAKNIIEKVNKARTNLHDAKAAMIELENCENGDPRKADPQAYIKALEQANGKVSVCRSIFNNFCKIRDDIKPEAGE